MTLLDSHSVDRRTFLCMRWNGWGKKTPVQGDGRKNDIKCQILNVNVMLSVKMESKSIVFIETI